jgi:hypothetical protein
MKLKRYKYGYLDEHGNYTSHPPGWYNQKRPSWFKRLKAFVAKPIKSSLKSQP